MGWVVMSERELRRIEVLAQVDDGRLGVDAGAGLLGLSRRQLFRLLARYRAEGAPAIRHRARGRAPNNRIHPAKRDYALALIRESYADFGPTLAAEALAERHDLKVSRETLRKWMIEAELWLPRAQRRRFHQPRLRRERLGELVQVDGSEHRWFEDRGPPCTLLVFVDDATSRLMQMRFVPSETTFAYFEALEGYLTDHGRPVAFYSDKHTVFRLPKPGRHGGEMTQFGRALAELQVEILCANSSQAKGRVERANRTLQDRLVKEMRLAGVSDIAAGNAFLPGFVERHNARFAKTPARPDDLHRPLNTQPDRLREILCLRDQRYVTRDLVVRHDRRRIVLEVNELTRDLPGRYVDTYELPDGRLQIRVKGMVVPFTAFDPDQQRVSHAAVTENKHLSAVLAHIKAEQDARPADAPRTRVRPSSARNGYQTTGRRNDGWNSKLARRHKARQATEAAERGADQASEP